MKNVREIRFVDLCAGLGGFHRGLELVAERVLTETQQSWKFRCVAAAELEGDLRECYARNFADVRASYAAHHPHGRVTFAKLNPRSTLLPFASDLPVYDDNGRLVRIHGDMACFVSDDLTSLRRWHDGTPVLPAHDLLCAGFPCQPFSKSGAQKGFEDTRGTVFHLIATMLREHSPAFVLLENVGNFGRHDGGNTWRRVHEILRELGYEVAATTHVGSGERGDGLLSPHHLGYPHHRERFFILGRRANTRRGDSLAVETLRSRTFAASWPFPRTHRADLAPTAALERRDARAARRLEDILSVHKTPSERASVRAARISQDRTAAIDHWNLLLAKLAELDSRGAEPSWRRTMPSFPIWGYELDPWHWYPFDRNPRDLIRRPKQLVARRANLIEQASREVREQSGRLVSLRKHPPRGERAWLARGVLGPASTQRWIETWPAYAKSRAEWPAWKQRFIEQNRAWALELWARFGDDAAWLRAWLDKLFSTIPAASNQKLEWNCKGDELDLWRKVLQFRPSGIRAKRLGHVPALVAMTTTQVPIVPCLDPTEDLGGARGRHLLPSEALELQGFPRTWHIPARRERAFACLGNAVHAEVVKDIAGTWFFGLAPSGLGDEPARRPSERLGQGANVAQQPSDAELSSAASY